MANVPSLSVVRDTAKPKKLGRYELEECLGVEGGRETHRARVRGLAGFDRVFIVKCFRRRPGVTISRTDPILLTAKRSTSVTDPRVARVLEADVIDGAAVVVTEFVQGLDLDRFREWAHVSGELATGTDPTAETWQRRVAYLAAEIAGALAAMHGIAAPLVHGGLSPRNVIVTASGGIKILDAGLGVAAQKGGEPPSARTQAYAAPGLPGVEPSAASDVRALGAMVFELATGEPLQPGVTSAAARRMLEPLWPAMAEFVASMLAEDPSTRPRAARVAEVMAGVWAGIPEATMATDLAALVHNFSAFVADGANAGGSPGPATETPDVEPISSSASGVLSVAPPAPPANSGSFFAVSDQATRVSPDGNYADALFQAVPGDNMAPSPSPPLPAVPAPPLAHGPASAAPARGLTMRSFSTIKPAEILASRAIPSNASGGARQAALPVLSTGPLARDAAAPALPPAPLVKPPIAATMFMAPPQVPASPRATVMGSPPPPPEPRAPAVAAATALSEPAPELVADEFSEPIAAEPLPEAVDWGAQALAALGTQAGIQITLAPSETGGDGLGAPQFVPPEVEDPAVEEAFALAPLPPPPNVWNEAQPASSGARMSPIEAPPSAAPGRSELLEEELLEDEPTPLLVSTRAGADAGDGYGSATEPAADYAPAGYPAEDVAAEGYASPADEGDAQALDQEPEAIQPTALEATAFADEDQDEFAAESAPVRVPQSLATAEPRAPRGLRSRSALKSRKGSPAPEGEEEEAFRPGSSRTKKVAIVLLAAAGLGAGAAALVLGPLGSKRPTAPVVMTGKSPAKAAGVKPAPASAPTEKAATTDKVATKPAGKADAKAESKVAIAAEGKGKTSEAKPSPAQATGKTTAAKPATEAPVPSKDKVALVAAPPALEAAAKVKPAAALNPPASAVAKTAAEAPSAPRPAPAGGSVRVRVSSQPAGAHVWVNGEERGDTPCSLDLKAGSARFALVHVGYLTTQTTVEIGEGSKIDETLKPVEAPMTGEARFRAECQTTGKLPIVVDGKETGILCPFSKMRVEPGNHNIGLLNPGTGKVHQKEVTLPAGVRSVVFQD